MKVVFHSTLVALGCWMLASPLSAGTGEFFCRTGATSSARFFTGYGICEESAECAFVPDEVRASVAREAVTQNARLQGKPLGAVYRNLSEQFKQERFSKLAPDLQFRPATLTCKGRLEPAKDGSVGSAKCPSPDHCKDEVPIRPIAATIELATQNQAPTTQVSGPGPASVEAGSAKPVEEK